MAPNVKALLEPRSQRRILTIDGGGIRGLIALGALNEIERILNAESGRLDFRLADYFDLIAGTSTGAVIAAGLSLGLPVARIIALYTSNAALIFKRAGLLARLLGGKYQTAGLTSTLLEIFGDETLGSDKLRTLVLFVMQNATTDSPWLVTNNPLAKYNDCALPDCNLRLPLWQLVRASAAAPTFFPAEEIKLGSQSFSFIDGATTPYNNPSFQAFLIATLESYRLQWPTGTEKILLVSVGTGALAHETVGNMNLYQIAKTIPLVQIGASSVEQDVLCRTFGNCLIGDSIDSEIGDLRAAAGPVSPKLFTYLRYNLNLTAKDFLAYGFPHIDPSQLGLDAIGSIDHLVDVGEYLGKRVDAAHFAGFPIPAART